MKMLRIGHEHAAAIPLTKRAAYERQLFGAQGSGAFSLLADDAAYDQIGRLQSDMNSPEFKNRYAGFMQSYNGEVTAQNARTSLQTFNVLMQDLGDKILPPANKMLNDFKSAIERRSVLPPGKGVGTTVAARAGEGALIGAGIGATFGGVGAIPGAAVGGVLGTAAGFMESYSGRKAGAGIDAGGAFTSPGKTGRPAEPKAQLAPITLNLNLDGRTLATTLSEIGANIFKFSTQAPAADGVGLYNGGGE